MADWPSAREGQLPAERRDHQVPQDELWATSARLTGWTAGYHFDVKGEEQDGLTFVPLWSKGKLSGHNGSVTLTVPSYMRWDHQYLLTTCIEELLGGVATNVPRRAHAVLRSFQHEYQEGSRH